MPTQASEFRGVWLATVDNTDWPSQPGLSSNAQKAELLTLLERAASLHLNAVLLQVRPGCDALYQSSFEPWSPVLTGRMGVPPSPFYDPLAFAIAEAHRRGLELHAWINPFRVRSKKNNAAASSNSVEIQHPDWVRVYGDVEWLDPGIPAVRHYSLAVINDILQRYDIDGIHIDDYFYPYPATDSHNHPISFPDRSTFLKYRGEMSLGDWRRANINDFVRRLYVQTKAAKPNVKVGISPFGIWRPGNPPQVAGFDAYENLYADSRLWLQQGWADYFTPQLYWPIDKTSVSFPVLLAWWQSQNTRGVPIWPGLNAGKNADNPVEIEYQIRTTRGFGCGGEIMFGASKLLATEPPNELFDHLLKTVFEEPARMRH